MSIEACKNMSASTKISNWVVRDDGREEEEEEEEWQRNDMGWKEVDRHELTVYRFQFNQQQYSIALCYFKIRL